MWISRKDPLRWCSWYFLKEIDLWDTCVAHWFCLCTVAFTSVQNRASEIQLLCTHTCSHVQTVCCRCYIWVTAFSESWCVWCLWSKNKCNKPTFWEVLPGKIVEDSKWNVYEVCLVNFVHQACLMAWGYIRDCLCLLCFLSSLYHFHEKEILHLHT